MCHQSVGLVARALEAAGVPTLSLTSSWDITRAVIPPRAVYVHYPLGHQAGRPGDAQGQVALLEAALRAGAEQTRPGAITRLELVWDVPGDQGWEDRAYTPEHTAVGADGKPNRGDPA